MSGMTQNPPTKSSIKSHRDLIVWQKAMDLVVSVYHDTETFPGSEMFGLTRQIRRAAASIPANIAEGQGRRFRKEFLSYLANARGSLWELDSHFELAARLGFLEPKLHSRLQIQMDEVGRILNGLMRSVANSSQA